MNFINELFISTNLTLNAASNQYNINDSKSFPKVFDDSLPNQNLGLKERPLRFICQKFIEIDLPNKDKQPAVIQYFTHPINKTEIITYVVILDPSQQENILNQHKIMKWGQNPVMVGLNTTKNQNQLEIRYKNNEQNALYEIENKNGISLKPSEYPIANEKLNLKSANLQTYPGNSQYPGLAQDNIQQTHECFNAALKFDPKSEQYVDSDIQTLVKKRNQYFDFSANWREKIKAKEIFDDCDIMYEKTAKFTKEKYTQVKQTAWDEKENRKYTGLIVAATGCLVAVAIF